LKHLNFSPVPATVVDTTPETHGISDTVSLLEQTGVEPVANALEVRVSADAREDLAAALASGDPNAQFAAIRIGRDFSDTLPAAIHTRDLQDRPENLRVLASLDLRQALALNAGNAIGLEITTRLRPKAVVFDLDGTLVNSLEAFYQVALESARSHGKTVTREFVRASLDANNHAFWESVFTEDEPNREATIEQVKFKARERWPDIHKTYVTAIDGVDDSIRALVDAGLKVGIVTAGSGNTITPLETSGVSKFFKTFIKKSDVASPKPDPQGLRLALEQLGVEPSEALYVGDSRIDLQTAHAAGCAPIAVLSGAGLGETLAAERPYRTLRSVADIADVIEV